MNKIIFPQTNQSTILASLKSFCELLARLVQLLECQLAVAIIPQLSHTIAKKLSNCLFKACVKMNTTLSSVCLTSQWQVKHITVKVKVVFN